MSTLTDQQELFCREYIVDLNATRAAIRAGYSEKTADVQGCRLLGNVKVQSFLRDLKAQRVEEVKTDANYVLKRLLEIDRLDVADILDDDNNLLPVKDWPKAWRVSVSAVDITELKSTEDLDVFLKKVRMPDKLRNLELLGKHIDISAFRERVELANADGKELVINVVSDNTKKGLQQLQDSLQKK